MAQQKPGKTPEARCPMCGSDLSDSPAGQQILQKASQAMAQKARGGPQGSPGGPQRPGGMPGQPQRPGMAPGGQGDPRMALKAALMQRMQQGRGR